MGKRRWRLAIGVLSALYGLARATLDFIGYVDLFIAHRNSQTETWLGKLMAVLFAPPSWTVFPLVIGGLGLIWWDLKRTPKIARLGTTDTVDATVVRSTPFTHVVAVKTEWEQESESLASVRSAFFRELNAAYLRWPVKSQTSTSLNDVVETATVPAALPLNDPGEFPSWVKGIGIIPPGNIALMSFCRWLYGDAPGTMPEGFDDSRRKLSKSWDWWGNHVPLDTTIRILREAETWPHYPDGTRLAHFCAQLLYGSGHFPN